MAPEMDRDGGGKAGRLRFLRLGLDSLALLGTTLLVRSAFRAKPGGSGEGRAAAPQVAQRWEDAHRETARLPTFRIALIALSALVLLGSCLGLMRWFTEWEGNPVDNPRVEVFPEPRLQSDPAGDLQALYASQRPRIEDYAWADREHGTVRIPVDRAMGMLAARGAAAYAPLPEPPGAVPPPVQAPAISAPEGGS